MRAILFRGKRKDNGEWVYGDLEHLSYGIITIQGHIVDPETVGEYAGLEDKNGAKIFDGDIVEDQFGNIGVISYSDHFLNWRIVFFKGREDLLNKLGAHIFEWVYPKMTLKVIGNVFDNPELLEGQAHNAE